jgi:hypothetical protein
MIIHTSENAISRLPHIQPDSSLDGREIAHLVLAGGPNQRLYNLSTGSHQRAVEFLCREAGAIEEDDAGHIYFQLDRVPERTNEILGLFAVAGVYFPATPVVASTGHQGTLEDLADSAMKTIRADRTEKAWSLMVFSIHPGVTAEWTNDIGEGWSVEQILQTLCLEPYGSGPCFGTHRLEGISFALRRFCLEQDLEPSQLAGVWAESYEYLRGALELMKRNQRQDGSLPRSWFREKSLARTSREWRELLKDVGSLRSGRQEALVHSTGHCLDSVSSLVEFLPDERDWMQSACYILAQTIESHWTSIGRRISSLTHGIHALKLIDV